MHYLFIYLFNNLFYVLFIYFFYFLHLSNLIKCFKPEIFKSICNKFISCHYISFHTLLLYFGSRAYLFSPEEGSCYVFTTRNNCCEFLAFYGVIQSKPRSAYLRNSGERTIAPHAQRFLPKIDIHQFIFFCK